MRYIISSVSVLVIALCFMLSATSCKKNNNGNATDTATLYLHLHTYIDSNEATPGTFYADSGRQISLDTAQFYITNVSLTNITGSTYTLPGIYTLKTIGTETYMIGAIPAGTFTSISFNVGVDPATNGTNPSNYTAPSPLALTNMFFSNASPTSYVFMYIHGQAKDNASATPVTISYKLGSNAEYETATLPVHTPNFTVAANQSLTVHIICDYGKLLRTITNFSSIPTADPYVASPATAKALAGAVPNMFRYEE